VIAIKPIVTAKNQGYFSLANRRILIMDQAVAALGKDRGLYGTVAVKGKSALTGVTQRSPRQRMVIRLC
jgi:hypothetical protein